MKWDGNEMNKMIRLSIANIKRHKKEAILLGVLIMLCAMLLASSVSSLVGIKEITPKMVEESGCYRNILYIDQTVYSDRLLTFFKEEAKVADYSHAGMVYGGEKKIKTYKGSGKDMYMDVSFMSEDGEKKLEKFQVVTKLSPEQLETLGHPVYLGKSEKDKLGVSEGEDITIFIDNKEFTYTVAGFYEAGIGMYGAKFVISGEDFRILEDYVARYEFVGFNTVGEADGGKIINEFMDFVKEVSVNDANQAVAAFSYEDMVQNNEVNMSNVSTLIVAMAGIIIISVIVMIRFRIVTDISEQMVSIGVLEAIGYTAKEIALSYIYEYVLIALVGCIAAFLPSIFMTSFLLKNAASFIHYCGRVDISYLTIIFIMVLVLLLVGFVAMTKALSVHKYPPVMALRKGIATHHFKRTILPLDKTKSNVHLRLALKDFFRNIEEKIGFIVCITVTSTMFLMSCFLGSSFSNGDKMLKSFCGHELADIHLEATGGTNPEDFSEELRSLPGVEKVLLSSASIYVKVNDNEGPFLIDIYEDFSETKTTIVTKGRLPKHENEIAITTQGSMANLKMGQTVTVEYDKVKRDYIVCGVVNSLVNARSIYMTEEGFKNLYPLYTPNAYKIFLSKDADRDALVKTLTARYGDEIIDLKNGEITGDTLEERIRSAARIKMAKAMSESGVSYMEYAIRVGNQVITGSTNNMKISSLQYEHEDYKDIMDQYMLVFVAIAAVLMAISAIVVIIILSILMSSAIRKQYKELGIMKGLGYTSRELKFQMAFKMIPPTVISVILGSFASIFMLNLIELVIAKITVSVLSIVFVDLLILLFCFLCAYVNARRIGKISVYELMTE